MQCIELSHVSLTAGTPAVVCTRALEAVQGGAKDLAPVVPGRASDLLACLAPGRVLMNAPIFTVRPGRKLFR